MYGKCLRGKLNFPIDLNYCVPFLPLYPLLPLFGGKLQAAAALRVLIKGQCQREWMWVRLISALHAFVHKV